MSIPSLSREDQWQPDLHSSVWRRLVGFCISHAWIWIPALSYVDLGSSLHLIQPHFPQPHMEMGAVLTCGVLCVTWDTTHSAWRIVRVPQHVAVADWLHLSSNMKESGHPAWASPPVLPVAANLTLHSSPLHPPHAPFCVSCSCGSDGGRVFENPHLTRIHASS